MREMVVLFVKLPEVPEMVTVTVPVVATPVADRLKRLVVVAGFAPKTALTPLGKPDALKTTLPLNPFCGLIVIVVEPAEPWRKFKLAGDAESVKLGCDEVDGQLFTRLAALTLPMPVAKSHPVVVP